MELVAALRAEICEDTSISSVLNFLLRNEPLPLNGIANPNDR